MCFWVLFFFCGCRTPLLNCCHLSCWYGRGEWCIVGDCPDCYACERLCCWCRKPAFSSESSMKHMQFLRVCPDLSSPRSFLNPCSVHGPSTCSLAERYARASSRGCLDLQSRF